ncbi:MAG: hypothetical protein ABSH44_19500 [Bryobacteraceae bacterium]|jgi:hypothetical protein
MSKRIHHMGMTLTKEKHDRFHKESPTLAPKQHEALMNKLGVTKEQDEEWHRTHLTLDEQRARATMGMKGINPFAVGGGFLAWCVKQGWLVQRGKQYFATREGARELRERFGIKV